MSNEFDNLVGKVGEATTVVTDTKTALHLGSGDVPVFGTPALVALMEEAAINALKGSLPAECTSVGTTINIQHLAATPLDLTVKATATVTAVEGRKVKFIVEAKDDKELVGKGEHERFILNKQRFLEKAEKKVKSE